MSIQSDDERHIQGAVYRHAINICVPVLKRYDRLENLFASLRQSTLQPDAVYVIDNGRNTVKLHAAFNGAMVNVMSPEKPMGVAESWNWFIQNVPEDRLITNDDIEFGPNSLAAMASADAPFVSCTFGFSCFIIRDTCIKEVGLFDESISPGYAYFEDMDYLRRMKLAGIRDDVVQCDVIHHHSQTPAAYTSEEMNIHHRRFNIAQMNYRRKWMANPSWEQLQAIGGAGANQ